MSGRAPDTSVAAATVLLEKGRHHALARDSCYIVRTFAFAKTLGMIVTHTADGSSCSTVNRAS